MHFLHFLHFQTETQYLQGFQPEKKCKQNAESANPCILHVTGGDTPEALTTKRNPALPSLKGQNRTGNLQKTNFNKGMKIHFSLPKNEGFFNDYATLTPTLYKLGFLAQVISAFTEVGILYALIFDGLKGFLPQYANYAAIAGALVGTAFLEVGLRQFLPYSARAILYRRFGGLHLVMSAFIFAVALGLLASSGYLSFRGSKDLVQAVGPAPKLESTAQADSLYRQEAGAIESRYSGQQEASREKFAALVNVERLNLQKYEQREQRTGRSYAATKQRITAKIAALEAQAAEAVAALEAAKGEELGSAHRRLMVGREKVEAGNEEAKAQAAAKVGRYGAGLAYFTVVCLFVLVLSIALDEVHRKGAGIESQALPTQYDFSQGIAGEFWAMASEKWNYYARAFIRRLADATPEAPQPKEAPTLWEYTPELKRRQIGFKPGSSPENSCALYSTPKPDGGTPNEAHETPDLREWKQRLKFYKKRLGGHEQKAMRYERKGEEIPKRTLEAIENNQQWVDHYAGLINQAEGRK